jgi:hypothetical protein
MHIDRFPFRLFSALLLSALTIGIQFVSVKSSLARQSDSIQQQEPVSVFLPAVKSTPLDVSEPIVPLDIVGYVVDRNSQGMGGVWIIIRTDGWNASDTTGPDGSFRFTLTPGNYSIEPKNLVSQPASFNMDGRHRVEIIFREVLVGTPVPTASPTPRPTLGPFETPSPGASPTPGDTPSVSATITPPAATTTVPILVATPTSTPAPVPLLPPIGVPLAPWLTPFMYGLAGGGAVALLVAVIWLWRRR